MFSVTFSINLNCPVDLIKDSTGLIRGIPKKVSVFRYARLQLMMMMRDGMCNLHQYQAPLEHQLTSLMFPIICMTTYVGLL